MVFWHSGYHVGRSIDIDDLKSIDRLNAMKLHTVCHQELLDSQIVLGLFARRWRGERNEKCGRRARRAGGGNTLGAFGNGKVYARSYLSVMRQDIMQMRRGSSPRYYH